MALPGGAAPLGGTDVTVVDVLGLETKIYNAADASLVWSGVTRSVSSGDIKTLLTDVGKAVRGQLQKQGLINIAAE